MNISARLLYGNVVSQNNPLGQTTDAKIRLTGTFAGKSNAFTLNDDILSKHTLFIGKTGCCKTTLYCGGFFFGVCVPFQRHSHKRFCYWLVWKKYCVGKISTLG